TVRAISTAFASASGLPLSSTSIVANSSACSSSRSASAHMRRARWLGGANRQAGKAALAALTAWSTSCSPARGASASGSPVAGFRTVSRPSVPTNSPSIYRRRGPSRKLGLGSAIAAVIRLLPRLLKVEDLPAEDRPLAERVERALHTIERVAAGDRHRHLAAGRQADGVPQILPGRRHRGYQRRLGKNELDGMDGQLLVG